MAQIQFIESIPRLQARPLDSHKGTFGKALIVAGSRGMAGAAVLCGSAALRSGAGLVQVICPQEIQTIISCGNPCYTTLGLSQDAHGHLVDSAGLDIITQTSDAQVLAVGPGLGQSSSMTAFVVLLLQRVHIPMVLDADALNAITNIPLAIWKSRHFPTILTPHPGEFARLIGKSTADVQAHREELAIPFAKERNVILVLKGHQTLVTDGVRMYRNNSGNPGMATGGTGDVLTGIITALVGQSLPPLDAAMIGTYVHGRAGDITAMELGEISLTASDLLLRLPRAFQEITEKRIS